MEIIPAIDLKSGLCVRLYQGDYGRETVYSDDPVSVAARWQREGATRLHVVDLDGASTGQQANLAVIEAMVSRTDIPLQVGGGVRDMRAAHRLLDIGVDRVVLGTAAVRDPGLVGELCSTRGGSSVVVAVDSRAGQVAIEGWIEDTSVQASQLIGWMADMGAERFLYTDISRDGTLTQPNFAAIEDLAGFTDYPILASGGIASVDHIVRLAAIGVEGAILGKALYTGAIDLWEAISAMTYYREQPPGGLTSDNDPNA